MSKVIDSAPPECRSDFYPKRTVYLTLDEVKEAGADICAYISRKIGEPVASLHNLAATTFLPRDAESGRPQFAVAVMLQRHADQQQAAVDAWVATMSPAQRQRMSDDLRASILTA